MANTIITPSACTRDKVIGRIVIAVIVVMDIKIAKSGILGTQVGCKFQQICRMWCKTGLCA